MFAGFWGKATQNKTGGVFTKAARATLAEVWVAQKWMEPIDDPGLISQVEDVASQLRPMCPATYVNEYATFGKKLNFADWKTRFYADYDQLLRVKKRYDPCNLYTVEYGSGYDKPTATCSN